MITTVRGSRRVKFPISMQHQITRYLYNVRTSLLIFNNQTFILPLTRQAKWVSWPQGNEDVTLRLSSLRHGAYWSRGKPRGVRVNDVTDVIVLSAELIPRGIERETPTFHRVEFK